MIPYFRHLLLCAATGLVGCNAGKGPLPTTADPDKHYCQFLAFHRTNGPAENQTGRKFALLVGCTRYPNLEDMDLEGPGNDVILMRKVLRDRFGFPDENIVTLAEANPAPEHKPTRRNIQREYARLAMVAKKGDQIVILMSGHGSQQPDQEPFDEPSGLDQLFLPSDTGRWLEEKKTVANAVVDDELGLWCRAITDKEASLSVIMDSCHSGTVLRRDPTSPEVVREVRASYLVPDHLLKKARDDAAERSRNGWLEPKSWMESAPGTVALYACQAKETTVERPPYDGSTEQNHGLLTYTLCQILTNVSSPITYKELTRRIYAEYARRRGNTPTPLIEGLGADREVLGLQTWPSRSQLLLARNREGGWKVNGGQLHFLTEKTILAVFPPAGAKGTDKPVGHVVVLSSSIDEAKVASCPFAGMEANDDLPVEGRCQAVQINYGNLQLTVAVAGTGDEAKVLLKHLQELAREENSLISLPADPKKAEFLFQIDKGQVTLAPAHVVWLRTTNPQPVASFAVGDQKAIRGTLEKISRARNLLRLTSTAAEDAVRANVAAALNVELIMLKLNGPKDKLGTPISWKKRGILLKDGDLVAFSIRNRSTVDVDVTLLAINSAYGIKAIYPAPNKINRLGPNETHSTGAFPIRAKDTAGLDHVAMIAIRGAGQTVDFTCLAQPSLQQARDHGADDKLRSPLGQLLSRAVFGQGRTRDLSAGQIDDYAMRLVSWNVEPLAK